MRGRRRLHGLPPQPVAVPVRDDERGVRRVSPRDLEADHEPYPRRIRLLHQRLQAQPISLRGWYPRQVRQCRVQIDQLHRPAKKKGLFRKSSEPTGLGGVYLDGGYGA